MKNDVQGSNRARANGGRFWGESRRSRQVGAAAPLAVTTLYAQKLGNHYAIYRCARTRAMYSSYLGPVLERAGTWRSVAGVRAFLSAGNGKRWLETGDGNRQILLAIWNVHPGKNHSGSSRAGASRTSEKEP